MAPSKSIFACAIAFALVLISPASAAESMALRGTAKNTENGQNEENGKNGEERFLIAKNWIKDDDVETPILPPGKHCSDDTPCKFMLIADLDSGNRDDEGKKIEFNSALMTGALKGKEGQYEFIIDEKVIDIETKYNEGGRGGELSELAIWRNKWLTADDRTGIIYQIKKKNHKLLPRFIFNEGDGSSSTKGFKVEWMTIQKDSLIVGSHGNRRKDDDGNMGNNLKWVVIVHPNGKYERVDWTKNYQKANEALGAGPDGYTTHEAIEWSAIKERWVILPRRWSDSAFDPNTDDFKGTNKFVICTADFSECVAHAVEGLEEKTLKGFSSFKFIPGTNDNVVIALRSAEDNQNDTQESFLSIFDLQGNLLVKEQSIAKHKLEGIAFI